MKLMITGGAGFIGSNLIRLLLEETNYSIICVDKLTYAGNLKNLRFAIHQYPSRFSLKIADISDKEALKNIFEEESVEAVINLAAESHVDRSILNSDPFIKTNIWGTQVLLDLSRYFKVKRFLQVSTDEVYGSLSYTSPTSVESDSLLPNSPYSSSKASADLLCRAAYKTHGLDVVITRCSNNYGPNQFPEKLIPLMVIKALKGESLPVYGDGSNIRDWIHVEDHCRGILAAFEKGQKGEIYNIGGGTEIKNINLVKDILQKLGKSEDLITFVKDRPGHDLRYGINCDKIKKECGWFPKHSFSDGLKNTIDWYLTNNDWYQEILQGDYQIFYQENYKDR